VSETLRVQFQIDSLVGPGNAVIGALQLVTFSRFVRTHL
jgi:hypothetical protein